MLMVVAAAMHHHLIKDKSSFSSWIVFHAAITIASTLVLQLGIFDTILPVHITLDAKWDVARTVEMSSLCEMRSECGRVLNGDCI